MNNFDKKCLTLELPNGQLLVARVEDDPEYPRIAIYLHRVSESDELLCFAEFNQEKPKGQELCVCAYAAGMDELVHYGSSQKAEEG